MGSGRRPGTANAWSWLVCGLALTCVVGAALAFGGVPGLGADDEPAEPDAAETAEAFFDAAIAGSCQELSRLTWYPVDIEQRRRDAVTTCREDAKSIADVELDDPRPGSSAQTPLGASEYAVVPARVELRNGSHTRVLVRLVRVDERWYVTS